MGSYFLSSSALHPTTNMKFLVLAACVAVSSGQGFYGLQSHPNGAVTPVDEPAVAAARADHLATKFGAGLGYAGYAAGYAAGYGAGYGYAAPVATGYAGYGAGNGYAGLGYAGYAPGYTAGYGYSGYAPAYAGAYGYAGPLNLNTQLIAHPNGAVVPLDEPAVAAARAAHLDTQAAECCFCPCHCCCPSCCCCSCCCCCSRCCCWLRLCWTSQPEHPACCSSQLSCCSS